MELEICAYSLESCAAARMAGATRIELCASRPEGGTTPSAATIFEALKLLKDGKDQPPLELYIMIRPRGGDFLYTDEEFAQMETEVEFIKGFFCRKGRRRVDGVVFGILTASGEIDLERTRKLVQRAKSGIYTDPVTGARKRCSVLGVTFHRAFDMSIGAEERHHYKVLEDVIATGADRILTSGFHPTAILGKEVLRELAHQAAGRISIMAGSGVGSSTALELLSSGVNALHMSGSAERFGGMIYHNDRFSADGANGGISEDKIAYTNPEAVKEVRRLWSASASDSVRKTRVKNGVRALVLSNLQVLYHIRTRIVRRQKYFGRS